MKIMFSPNVWLNPRRRIRTRKMRFFFSGDGSLPECWKSEGREATMNCSFSEIWPSSEKLTRDKFNQKAYNQFDNRIIESIILHVPGLLNEIKESVHEIVIKYTYSVRSGLVTQNKVEDSIRRSWSEKFCIPQTSYSNWTEIVRSLASIGTGTDGNPEEVPAVPVYVYSTSESISTTIWSISNGKSGCQRLCDLKKSGFRFPCQNNTL